MNLRMFFFVLSKNLKVLQRFSNLVCIWSIEFFKTYGETMSSIGLTVQKLPFFGVFTKMAQKNMEKHCNF